MESKFYDDSLNAPPGSMLRPFGDQLRWQNEQQQQQSQPGANGSGQMQGSVGQQASTVLQAIQQNAPPTVPGGGSGTDAGLRPTTKARPKDTTGSFGSSSTGLASGGGSGIKM